MIEFVIQEKKIMKIAVTCENHQVFQHFGHTPGFAVFEAEDIESAVCPICKAKGDKLKYVTEAPANKYSGTKTEKMKSDF